MSDAINKSNGMNCIRMSDAGVLPWCSGIWKERIEDHGIQLFIDGWVARANSNCGGEESYDERENLLSIISLYQQKGAKFVEELRGSFVVGLWDSHDQKLILATDQFGTRPIYYWLGSHRIAFATRISEFSRTLEIPKKIESNSLYFYLNHSFIPAPFTIYKDIHRLEPGEMLQWTRGHSSVKRYWDMTYVENVGLREDAAADLLRLSLEDSVHFALRNRLKESEKIGAFLSGGTDSSTLVGLIGRSTSKRVESFSVGFEEKAYNELNYARIAAKHFNSIAHEYIVSPEEALDAIPKLSASYDEPFGNSSAIPTYFCLKMASEADVSVMFAGDGGDELFGGNERYITEKLFSHYQRIPRSLRVILDYGAEVLPGYYPLRKVSNYIRKANQPPADRFFAYQLYFRDHAAKFLAGEFRASLDHEFPIEVARRHYRSAGEVAPLNRLLYVDLKMAVADNDLFKVNRAAEYFGIQVLYPYLDPVVGRVSGQIPARLKIKGWSKRYIFKKAFANFLPSEILAKKKHGFGLPTGDWLRNHSGFKELARSLLLDPRSIQRGYFRRSALEGLLKNHDEEHSGYFGSHIWNLMMLELWHRAHADGMTNTRLEGE